MTRFSWCSTPLPFPEPLLFVVGSPIDVPKNADPTKEEVNVLFEPLTIKWAPSSSCWVEHDQPGFLSLSGFGVRSIMLRLFPGEPDAVFSGCSCIGGHQLFSYMAQILATQKKFLEAMLALFEKYKGEAGYAHLTLQIR